MQNIGYALRLEITQFVTNYELLSHLHYQHIVQGLDKRDTVKKMEVNYILQLTFRCKQGIYYFYIL